MHSETFIAKLTEVQQTVQQLLADLQRSERGQFAVVTSTALPQAPCANASASVTDNSHSMRDFCFDQVVQSVGASCTDSLRSARA